MSIMNPLHIKSMPGPAFSVVLRALGYLRPYWRETAGAYFGMLLVTALALVIPQFIRQIVDVGIGQGALPGAQRCSTPGPDLA